MFKSLLYCLKKFFVFILVLAVILSSGPVFDASTATVSAATIQPPAPSDNPKPSPGQNYPISPALEANLSQISITMDPAIPGIQATIPFGGRTWNTWQTNQEQDIMTSLDTGTVKLSPEQEQELDDNCRRQNIDLSICNNVDIIIVAVVVGSIVVGYSVMLAGPGTMAFVQAGAARQAVAWAYNGITGAITAGSINAWTRFQNSPTWLQISGQLALAFAYQPSCELVSRMPCPHLTNVPNLYFPRMGIPSVNQVENALGTNPATILNNSTITSPIIRSAPWLWMIEGPVGANRIKLLAKTLGFNGVSNKGSYGTVYFSGNKALKVYHEYGTAQIDRINDEFKALTQTEGIIGVPKIHQVIRLRDVTDQSIYNADSLVTFFRNGGVKDDHIVGFVMDKIEGFGIDKFRAVNGKISRQVYEQGLKTYDDIVKRTSRGLGDHYGNWDEYGDLGNSHSQNTIITLDNTASGFKGSRINFIDFGGDERYIAGSPFQLRERQLLDLQLSNMLE